MNFTQAPYHIAKEKMDRQFFSKFRSGDANAFEQIYNTFFPGLLYFAKHLIHDEMEAQDIVLETFYKLWNLRDGFENLNNTKAFLYLATRNACFDYLKHIQRRLAIQKEILMSSDIAESPSEQLNHTFEITRIIHDEIEKLPSQAGQVFKMVYFEELKIAEIALILKMTKQAVRNNKSRAILLLKKALFHKVAVLLYNS